MSNLPKWAQEAKARREAAFGLPPHNNLDIWDAFDHEINQTQESFEKALSIALSSLKSIQHEYRYHDGAHRLHLAQGCWPCQILLTYINPAIDQIEALGEKE